MDYVFDSIDEWLKDFFITCIMDNLSDVFNAINNRVGEIANQVGLTPSAYSPGIFNMITNLSENVIMPIAGILLTFIACYELITLVTARNNLMHFDTFVFWKWIFKTFVAVTLITNTMNMTMAVFDVAQHVVNASGGIIAGSTAIDDSALASLESSLEALDNGSLMMIFMQSFIVRIAAYILSILIFVIVNARMIEIYLMVSLAPLPFATFGNREQSMIGQNYLRSLFALGFQGFLIMICVGIYALLIQTVTFSTDIVGSLWEIIGYTTLLAFTLFKTGTVAKSILHAH